MEKKNIFMEMAQLKDLSSSERQVVNYVLKNPHRACEMTIVELGVNSFTSASTVSRLCQKLNLKGFPDFKQKICSDLHHYQEYLYLSTNRVPIRSSDTIDETVDKVISNSAKALADVKLLNSGENFQTAITWLQKADKITLYGSGVSNLISHDGMIKGIRMGLNIQSFTYYSEMAINARLSKLTDLGVIVSYTGLTVEMVKVARILKLNKCRIISITSNSSNEIAELADLSLFVANSESFYRIGGIESRMSMQCVLDIIFSGYYNQVKKAKETSEKTFINDTFSYNWDEKKDE